MTCKKFVTMARDWFEQQNEERERWGKRHGFTKEDSTWLGGLIDYPGLGDRLPTPEPLEEPSFPSPNPPTPNPVLVKLWTNFSGHLEALEFAPPLWEDLSAAVNEWLLNPFCEDEDGPRYTRSAGLQGIPHGLYSCAHDAHARPGLRGKR